MRSPDVRITWHDVIEDGGAILAWRVRQLHRLGVPIVLASAVADRVDWHQVARLVRRGCPARLALAIAI